MKFIIILTFLLSCSFTVAWGQKDSKHIVYFEAGQSSISLAQLDSIKRLAKQSVAMPNSRFVVHTYANDALEGDANNRLSGRRAFLVQQCLEREGVSLAYMHVENKVRHETASEGCGACAEILMTTDSNFFFQNIYHERLTEFLTTGSEIQTQIFWIKPYENALITTKEGVLIRIPSNSLAVKDSSLVKLELRFLKSKWDMLLHALTTRSVDQECLELNRALHLTATQGKEQLVLKQNQYITVILPSDTYHKNATAYEKEGSNWATHEKVNDLKFGSFYGGDNYFCSNAKTGLGLPNYAQVPSKPKYLDYDSMTIEQDKIIKSVQVRLDYLEEQKTNEKGKPQELNPQQKRNETLLKGQKDRALIVKQKIRIETRQKNEAMEEAYYKELAAYNAQRNSLQQAYIKGLDSLGGEQKDRAERCKQHLNNAELLRKNYGQDVYEKIAATLRNFPTTEKTGYWLKTNQLGWLGLGQKSDKKSTDAVPYRVTTTTSAYKITTFLIFDKTQDIVIGETLDATDIVFWEVPDGQSAKLLAVTQEGDNFLVAFHEVVTSGNPIQLQFKQIELKEVLGRILN